MAELPKTTDALAKEIVKLRHDLAKARSDHAQEKLDSPAKLRGLRANLARALTKHRQLVKEIK